jgi:peroxiredoxin
VTISIGDRAPDFELPAADGGEHSLADEKAPATLVYWTCNHCPYALAWHERMLALAGDYATRGVRTLAVNSNDGDRYPDDSLEAMRERVGTEDWNHPYLHDGDQTVARAWGAEKTPELFVLDADLRLRYRGAPDADYDDPAQNAAWAREALDAVLDGRDPEPAETPAVGCSLKWKP